MSNKQVLQNKRILFFGALLLFSIGIFGQDAPVQRQAPSEDGFSKAFLRIVQSAENAFKDIVLEETYKDGFMTYNRITVNFPSAIQTGYRFDFDWGSYETTYTIEIKFYNGDNSGEADRIFANVKNSLKTCLAENKGGRWKIIKGSSPDSLKAKNQDQPALEVEIYVFWNCVTLKFMFTE